MAVEKKIIASDLKLKEARSQEKNKYSKSFKDQEHPGSFFLRTGNSEAQRFSFSSTVNQTSMTQTETEQGINKPADIHLQSKTKKDMPERFKHFNDQTKQK